MDLSTVLGVALAWLFVGTAIYLGADGKAAALIDPTSFLVVLGGCIAATMAAFPFSDLKRLPKVLMKTVFWKSVDVQEVIVLGLVFVSFCLRRFMEHSLLKYLDFFHILLYFCEAKGNLLCRLKEIINRGGEKISPLEVDGVLMDFPAIAQVVTFALPHPKLGEEVAAAVVLREGQTATERDIRDFAATRMADFKVPRKVVILDEIPKGATGKMQRIGMAEKLGLVEKAG